MENNTAPMTNMCMDWNDTIESDGEEFIVLPEGDYAFTVTNFERGRFPGSAKLPPCNKSTLTLAVDAPGGGVSVKTDLILYRTLEWKIASFFRSVGLKKHGERLVMDWNRVVGAKGFAHIKPRAYTYNGREYTANDVEQFIDPETAEKKNLRQPAGNAVPDWVQEADRQIAQQSMQPSAQQDYRQQQYPPQYAQQTPQGQPQNGYPQQQYTQQQMNWKEGQF